MFQFHTEEEEEAVPRRQRNLLLGSIVAGVIVASCFFGAWYVLDRQEHEHIDQINGVMAKSLELLVRQDLNSRMLSLADLAERVGMPGSANRASWESNAQAIVQQSSGYEAIEWVDQSMRILWAIPVQGDEAVLDLDLRENAAALMVAQRARELGRIQWQVQDQHALRAYVPVYRNESFDGLMIAALPMDSWLNALLPESFLSNHNVAIAVQGHSVLPEKSGFSLKSNWVKHVVFVVNDIEWQISVAPKTDLFSLLHHHFSVVLLLFGFPMSILVSLATYFVLLAFQRTSQLKTASESYKSLLQNLPGMSYRCLSCFPWVMDFASESCNALCGYSAKEIVEKQVLWGHLIVPEDLERVKMAVGNAVLEGHAFEVEYRIRTRSGQEKWVRERGYPTVDTDGEDTILTGLISDITDQKRAQISLVREQSFSHAIVETAVEAVITINRAGKIESFNPAAQEMFGYGLDEIKGTDFNVLLATQHQDDLKRRFERVTADEAVDEMGGLVIRNREVVARHADHSDFPVLLSVSEMQHQDQSTFVCLIRDITQQRQAEAKAREYRDGLAHFDRLNLLEGMVSGIAHEINQPLTAISLFSQAGKRFLALQEYARLPDIFEKLSVHAMRAGNIIEHMQNMSRQHDSVMAPMDCNVAIKKIVTLAEAESSMHDIAIEMQLGTDLPNVVADEILVQQVILNLLRNGMESMILAGSNAGEVIQITTRKTENNNVEILVTDTGLGVAEELSSTLFKAFLTTKKTGMGMGLAISHAIATDHGGLLSFSNNPAGGATFMFTLPGMK